VSALDHANICGLHTVEETADGRLFLVMARYKGKTLRERLAEGPLPAAEALDTAAQVLGLAAVHRIGIVHRDLSSGNVMLTDTGAVKVMDFGLARLPGAVALTQSGQAVGTVSCMSPEQARGAPVDSRADLWAVGVLLYVPGHVRGDLRPPGAGRRRLPLPGRGLPAALGPPELHEGERGIRQPPLGSPVLRPLEADETAALRAFCRLPPGRSTGQFVCTFLVGMLT
jgi:serine/threonine protein kinase